MKGIRYGTQESCTISLWMPNMDAKYGHLQLCVYIIVSRQQGCFHVWFLQFRVDKWFNWVLLPYPGHCSKYMKTIYSHNNCHKGFLSTQTPYKVVYTPSSSWLWWVVLVEEVVVILVEEVVGGEEEERPDSMVPLFTQLYGCLVVSLWPGCISTGLLSRPPCLLHEEWGVFSEVAFVQMFAGWLKYAVHATCYM